MIVLGLVLIVLGWLLPIPYVATIGLVLLVVGLILLLVGALGHPVGGRKYWY